MSTFARIVDGVALDCQVADDASELAARFHPEWLARNPFTQVPDGTAHGAVSDGHGGWINPPPAPVPAPLEPQPVTDPIAELKASIKAIADVLVAVYPNAAASLKTDLK